MLGCWELSHRPNMLGDSRPSQHEIAMLGEVLPSQHEIENRQLIEGKQGRYIVLRVGLLGRPTMNNYREEHELIEFIQYKPMKAKSGGMLRPWGALYAGGTAHA